MIINILKNLNIFVTNCTFKLYIIIQKIKGRKYVEDLGEMYKSYAKEVKIFLILLTSDVDLAEELTQETFYQAVKSIHRYNGECKLSVWLCQIAKYTYYNHLKKERKNKHLSVENMIQIGSDIPSNRDGPDIEIIKRNTLNSIHKQIHLLKEPYREIFLLRTSINLSFKEIGERFGKSENWARVTYYRAKTSLADKIQDEY